MNMGIVEKLVNAPSCCPELKKIANDWLNDLATDEELLEEVKQDVTTIDDFIEFTESEMGKVIFGEEKANNMNIKAKEAKEAGEKYCICPACQVCKELLEE